VDGVDVAPTTPLSLSLSLSLSAPLFCLDDTNTKNKKMNDVNTKKLKGNLKK
jgi:hypothetical protein